MHSTKRTIGAVALTATLFFGGFACSSGGSNASFCTNAKKYTGKTLDDPSTKEFSAAMEDLRSSAPSEIKSEMNYVADWAKKLQDIDPTDPKAAANAMKGFDEKKMTAASDKLDKYLKDKCGIDSKS